MIGCSGSVASVNIMAMQVVSAATTNGPRSFRNALTSASAAFWPVDFLVTSGKLVTPSVGRRPKNRAPTAIAARNDTFYHPYQGRKRQPATSSTPPTLADEERKNDKK
jgi:hypothetical protein